MLSARIRLLLAALWVGSMWTIGYIAALTLFVTLDNRALAGTLAGKLFRIEAWLSLACGIALLLLFLKQERAQRGRMPLLIASMLACTLIGYFGLQPFMSELRATAGAAGVMNEAVRSRFGLLHGIASGFYFMQSLLGGMLLWKLR